MVGPSPGLYDDFGIPAANHNQFQCLATDDDEAIDAMEKEWMPMKVYPAPGAREKTTTKKQATYSRQPPRPRAACATVVPDASKMTTLRP